MDDQSISVVVDEIQSLVGQAPGKIFQLGPLTIVIDFRLRDGYLFISAEPNQPRIYLIKRRVRELEKSSVPLSQFALSLRKELSNTTLSSIEKDSHDRVVHFQFAGENDSDEPKQRDLIAQLTGRAANLFLLDTTAVIIQRLRATDGAGQQPGEAYKRPTPARAGRERPSDLLKLIESGEFGSASEAADAFYSSLLSAQAFDAQVASARADLRKKISRQQKLLKQLQNDLASHAGAAEHKRIGDLLLANVSTAKRKGGRVKLIDYFAMDAPFIEVELDENSTLPQEAARRFKLYSRSKRAVTQITSRIGLVQSELTDLNTQKAEFEKLVAARKEMSEPPAARGPQTGSPTGVQVAGGPYSLLSAPPAVAGPKRKREIKIPGTRRYLSSDGFQILVGRAARDNDHLSFKVAKPNDLWLHAADYPGSHVIVRNSTRKDIPHRTVIEAAQLAAYFSQANKDPKVDVHYTPRKFISKPKGSAPGLVRMSRFKNIVVAPKEAGTRE